MRGAAGKGVERQGGQGKDRGVFRKDKGRQGRQIKNSEYEWRKGVKTGKSWGRIGAPKG
jgi:hypothetical protein